MYHASVVPNPSPHRKQSSSWKVYFGSSFGHRKMFQSSSEATTPRYMSASWIATTSRLIMGTSIVFHDTSFSHKRVNRTGNTPAARGSPRAALWASLPWWQRIVSSLNGLSCGYQRCNYGVLLTTYRSLPKNPRMCCKGAKHCIPFVEPWIWP